MTSQPHVFVSYSHKDKAYAEDLMVHIAPLRLRFEFDLRSDHPIEMDVHSFNSELEAALTKADIAILLVSADYLASSWITRVELPRLLKRAKMGEIRIIPIILRPSPWTHTPLAYFQAFPRNGEALSALSDVERDRAWVQLYEVLEAELHRLSKGQELPAQPPGKHHSQVSPADELPKVKAEDAEPNTPPARTPPEVDVPKFFISHAKEDGDFAENLKGRLKEVGLDGWIDIDVLEAGVDWRKEIDEAILDSRALILVLSPDSKSSEYVTYEWAFALGSGLRIVPLMLRDTSIHPRLEIFQYLDFTNRRARPWDRLFVALQDASESAPNNQLKADDDPAGRRA